MKTVRKAKLDTALFYLLIILTITSSILITFWFYLQKKSQTLNNTASNQLITNNRSIKKTSSMATPNPKPDPIKTYRINDEPEIIELDKTNRQFAINLNGQKTWFTIMPTTKVEAVWYRIGKNNQDLEPINQQLNSYDFWSLVKTKTKVNFVANNQRQVKAIIIFLKWS